LGKKIHHIFGLQHSKLMAHLTLEQRYKIEAYRNAGSRISEIAQLVDKDKSVISREIKRNCRPNALK
jgi:IS30 family transposase